MKCVQVLVVMAAFALSAGTDIVAQTERRDPGIPPNMSPARMWRKRDYQTGFWRLAKISTDYRLGPGDVLEIAVYDAPSISDVLQATMIPGNGEVVIPLLGNIRAAGLTAEQLEQTIAGELRKRGLIEEPDVLVTVVEYQAKAIYVIGQVDNPGQYIMSQPWTLTEAVLIAGGLDLRAGSYGYLHRRVSSGQPPVTADSAIRTPEVAAPGYEVKRFDLKPLKQGGILEPDVPLQDGDLFVVSTGRPEMAYVIGDVPRQGAVALTSGSAPVSRVLSAAGGLLRTAKGGKGTIVRYEEDGKRRELSVDYTAILAGKRPDFMVQANDVIFVPGSQGKTLGFSLLFAVPQIIQNAAILAIIP